ncbi:DsbA family protein [Lysobacter fragariae]
MPTQAASQTVLHYIFDPFCGWCYAAAPLIEAAASIPGITVTLHAGGMMTGANRRNVSPQWREFVLPHDRRIAQASGQPFGAAYFDGLLRDSSVLLDSEPPIAAILATQSLGGRGLQMLHAIQHAHYVDGRHVARASVLRELAMETGIDGDAFSAAFAGESGERVHAHMTTSRRLLAEVGGRGFPTIALRMGSQPPMLVDSSPYLGDAQSWTEHLAKRVANATPHRSEAAQMAVCGPDTCQV